MSENRNISTADNAMETFKTDSKYIALSTIVIDQIIALRTASVKANTTAELMSLSLVMTEMIKCYIGLENLNTCCSLSALSS